jgi:hypothetical protein
VITRRTLYAPIVEADAELDWEMANSIQITPTDLGDEQQHVGVVIARPHATGWFVSARCRHGLGGAEVETFKDFVTARVYLLLQEGPRPGAWTRGESDDEWRTHAVVGTHDASRSRPGFRPRPVAMNEAS